MSRKNNKGKPTRKEINEAITNISKGLSFVVQKLEYIENFAKSTDLALDLYTKFNKNHKEFTKYIEEYNKKEKLWQE